VRVGAPPNIQYSPGYDWCERYQEVYAISSCEEQNPRIDLDATLGERSVWYGIAPQGRRKRSGARRSLAWDRLTLPSMPS